VRVRPPPTATPQTTEFDKSKLVFVPWDSHFSREEVLAAGEVPIAVVDAKATRFRNTLNAVHLLHVWNVCNIPRMRITTTDSFTGKKVFSNCQVSLYISRRALASFMYEFLRPISIAAVCPVGVYVIKDPIAKVTFTTSLILTMSVAFQSSKTKRITLADYGKISYFMYSIAVLAAVLPEAGGVLIDKVLVDLITWGLFVLVNGGLLAYLLTSFPGRAILLQQHSAIKANTIETVGSKLKKGVSSLVPTRIVNHGGPRNSGDKHDKNGKVEHVDERDLVRQQTFGDDD
jgi:hypothetical protein